MNRSRTIGCGCACVLALAGAPALAQTSYPTQQIRIVCPFPAGGGTDLTSRLLAEQLHKSMGQTGQPACPIRCCASSTSMPCRR